MRTLVLLGVLLLGFSTRSLAISPECDATTTGNTGDVCISGTEELSTQSYKLSFLDDKTGWTCGTATGGIGSMWIAHDFDADPDIGPLPVLCVDDADMDPDGSLRIIPRGTLTASARRTAGVETTGLSGYDCTDEADAGRIEIFKGSDPPSFKWCHWNGTTASSVFVTPAAGDNVPLSIGASADMDSTCDATGTFTNGDTVITLTDYANASRQTLITATISFTAAASATFTIKAKLEGSQVGPDVTCSAAVGFKTSCTISIVDVVSSPDRTFTVTASQSTGILNTVDTCNVTRFTTWGS